MKFSVVATFSGVRKDVDGKYYPCDAILQDAINAAANVGLDCEATEPGDSEYSYLGREDGDIPDWVISGLEQSSGARRLRIARWILDRYPRGWFAVLSDVQICGVLTRDQFNSLIDGLGAYAEDCETMGTLGGPLGGHVPDISFRMESQYLIDSIRVTPIPENRDGEPLIGDSRTFDRLRQATLSVYGC